MPARRGLNATQPPQKPNPHIHLACCLNAHRVIYSMTRHIPLGMMAWLELGMMVPAVCGQGGTVEGITQEAAVQKAAGSHPEAQIAELRMAAARAAMDQAQAAFGPKLRLQTGYLGTNQPVSVFGIALNQRAFGPGLNFNDVPTAHRSRFRCTLAGHCGPVVMRRRRLRKRGATRLPGSSGPWKRRSPWHGWRCTRRGPSRKQPGRKWSRSRRTLN